MRHHQAAKFLAIVAIMLCILFTGYFVCYTVKERDMYETEALVLQRVTSECFVSDQEIKACQAGFVLQGSNCAACPEGTFSLEGWSACKVLLTCDDVRQDVRTSNRLYTLGNWHYFLAEWKGYEVLSAQFVTSSETSVNFKALPGIMSGSNNMLTMMGFCESSSSVVFSHDTNLLGSALKLDFILKQRGCDHWVVRFHLAKDYVQILSRLHTTPGGPHVFCNSNTVEQVLSQFLISQDMQLVLVNLDNLPQVSVNGNIVKCSKVELSGNSVAPEQHWPYAHHKVFNYDEQPGYDEKSDIWKIPQVTRRIMGTSDDSEWIMDYLASILDQCRSEDPKARPNINEVLNEFVAVWALVTESSHYS